MRLTILARVAWVAVAGLAVAGFAATQPVHAADTVRAGKAVGVAWTFTPLDVGQQMGIFAKQNINLEISAFAGDAKLQAALTSKSVDFGLGSGPGMGFMAKGVPAKAVAAYATSPNNLAVFVSPDSPIKSLKDLKGKKIGVTTQGSLTYWLARRIAVTEGWNADDVTPVPLGSTEANIAGMKTGQVDAIVLATEACYALQAKGQGREVANLGSMAPKFHTHVVFSRDDLIANNPDLIKRFLTGFFDSIKFMKDNKEKTVEITSKVLNFPPEVISRAYDEEITMLKTDGKFDPEAVKVIKESLPALGILDHAPEDDVMFTTQFVGKWGT